MHCTQLLMHFMGAAKMELLEDGISIHVGDLHALLFDSCHC